MPTSTGSLLELENIASLLLDAAREYPNKPALVTEHTSLTFAELAAVVANIARKLRNEGVVEGNFVGINLPTALHIPFMLAVFSLGAVAVRYTPTVAAAGQIELDWVFSVAPMDGTGSTKNVLVTEDYFTPGDITGPLQLTNPKTPQNLCLVVHSSGTTGTPKAVGLSIDLVRQRLVNHTHWVGALPYLSIFDMGAWIGVRSALVHLANAETYHVISSANEAVARVRAAGIRQVECSPAQLTQLVEAAKRGGWQLDSLESVVVTGAAIPGELARQASETLGCEVFVRYGATEMDVISLRNWRDHRSSNVGSPLPGVEVCVTEEGAVLLKAPWMVDGYLSNPSASHDHFIDGWYHPGDKGYLDQGSLVLEGRTKDIINVGGMKVSTSVIENWLPGKFGVTDAAGFAHIAENGLEEYWLAVVGDIPDLAALALELKNEFAIAAPARIVQETEIQRNSNGKIMRSRLSERHAL